MKKKMHIGNTSQILRFTYEYNTLLKSPFSKCSTEQQQKSHRASHLISHFYCKCQQDTVDISVRLKV